MVLVLIPVNKPPHFSLATQFIAVPERTSHTMQTFSKFAIDISAGQPAERSQALQFYCETDNVFLFDAQPSISYDETLSFKLSANTFGQANVTVHLFEIGGLSLRFSSYFVVHVNRSYDAPSILSLSSSLLNVYEGSMNRFDRFILFETEPNLPPNVLLRFNVSLFLNKSAPFFLMDNDASLINASITLEGHLLVSCALKSWGQIVVGVSLMQSVVNDGVESFNSFSDTKVFSIFVSPVNDAPSFTIESEILVISQQQTSFTSSSFIRNIDVGPADEKLNQVISQMYCMSSHRAIKSVVVVSQCLYLSSCPSASILFDLVAYSQGSANVTCCVSETPPGPCPDNLSCLDTTCKQFVVLIPAVLHTPPLTLASSPCRSKIHSDTCPRDGVRRTPAP